MKKGKEIIRRLIRDERGAVSLEWSLLLAAFGIPMLAIFTLMLATLAEHYRMMSFVLSLPYP